MSKYRLKIPEADKPRWPKDVARIRDLMGAAFDLEISERDAEWLWEDYSESYAAGWLNLPNDDRELLSILTRYVEEDPDAE